MKHLLLVLVLALGPALSVPAFAQSYERFASFEEKGFTNTLTLTLESGRYVLDVFRHSEEVMQVRTFHATFADRAAALEAFEAQRAVLAERADPPPPANPDEDGDMADLPAEPVMAAPYDFSPRFVTEDKTKVLWKATQLWSWEWEVRYSQWIAQEVDAKFFSRHGIATDCADVAIGLRWIFARMHGLPVGNTLAASSRLFTHASFKKSWSGLKRGAQWYEDELFLAALDYIMDGAYTKTLLLDSYPVRIRADVFLPGVHHLQFHAQGGHTMLVKAVKARGVSNSPLLLLQSTLPRKVRDLAPTGYHISTQPQYDGGFLRIRHLVVANGTWVLAPASKHVDFSEEQFEEEFMSGHAGFSSAVKAHLLGRIDGAQEFMTSLKLLREALESRLKVVSDGYLACQRLDCRPGTEGYEEWSTPVRDSKLKDLTTLVVALARQNMSRGSVKNAWNEFTRLQVRINDVRYPMSRILENILNDRLVGDPSKTPEARWGL